MTAPTPARPAYLDLAPAAAARGEVALPGSKSISNRTLLLAALADGPTRVCGLLDADDVDRMLEALATLGVRVDAQPGTRDFVVHGTGGTIPVRSAQLFLGNAGHGDPAADRGAGVGRRRLRALRRAADARAADRRPGRRRCARSAPTSATSGEPGYPPLAIRPGELLAPSAPDRVAVRGDVSSQFLSALLMALPLLASRRGAALSIDVVGELISKPYVAITTNLLARFGVDGRAGRLVVVPDPGRRPGTRARARSTSRATPRPRRTFSRPARSPADRCG